MKVYCAYLLLLLLVLSINVYPQSLLSKKCNEFRSGDCLVKQQVEYEAPGDSGENVLWDFSRLEPVNDHYELKYYSYDDSVMIGREQRTLYKYIQQGDSLFSCGFENKTTLIANCKPELLLVYPAAYGSRYEDYFHGNGDYCGQMFLTSRGKSSVETDGYGSMILPEGDTLRHVLRIHHVKNMSERLCPYPLIEKGDTVYSPDSIDYHLATDTLRTRIDTYRWYAEGYRYPVFETIRRTVFLHQKPSVLGSMAFCYTPVEQYYSLEDDPENSQRRDSLNNDESTGQGRNSAKRRNGSPESDNDTSTPDNNNIFNCTILPDTEGNTVSLSYDLREDAEVSVQLFDVQGRCLTRTPLRLEQRGNYTQQISLDGYSQKEYILRIVVNGHISGEKLIKR